VKDRIFSICGRPRGAAPCSPSVVSLRVIAAVSRAANCYKSAVASLLGLSLADCLRAEDAAKTQPYGAGAKACIFIFLEGGPSQLETFDPKPQATDDTRGPFGSIATTVSGYHVGELLPMLARQADRYAVIRSVTGFSGAHDAYQTLTGDARNRTSHGAVVKRLTEHQGAMPPYVHLGGKLFRSTDVGGGVLGSAYDPVEIADPLNKNVKLPDLSLSADVLPRSIPAATGPLGRNRPGAIELCRQRRACKDSTPSISGQ